MPFVKGKKIPGQGRPKLPANINTAMGEAKLEVLASIAKFGMMPRSRFNEYLKTDQPTMWERVTAGCFVHAGNGSLNHINALWDRVIGPVPKPIQALDADGKPKDTHVSLFQSMDADQLTQFVVNLRAKAEACKAW